MTSYCDNYALDLTVNKANDVMQKLWPEIGRAGVAALEENEKGSEKGSDCEVSSMSRSSADEYCDSSAEHDDEHFLNLDTDNNRSSMNKNTGKIIALQLIPTVILYMIISIHNVV